MVQPFSALPAIFTRIGGEVTRGTTRKVQSIAIAAGTAAIDATRVDTGLARSNWLASLNSPRTDVIPPYASGNKLGRGETGNRQGAISQNLNVIRTYDVRKDRTIYITNNVKYIQTLNDGRPGVTADNMAAKALQAGIVAAGAAKVLRK